MSFKSYLSNTSMISRHAFAVAFGTAVIATPFVASADSATEQQIQQLQMQIDALKKQVSDMPKAAPAPSLVSSDGTVSLYGITVYGTLDAGVSYQNHGANIAPSGSVNVYEFLQKNSSGSHFNVMNSGMSQNKIGLKGKEQIMDDFYAVFQVESGFNVTTGQKIDGGKTLIENNGRSINQTTAYADSARMGQLFDGMAYVGAMSPTYGQLTFGRHTTPLADMIGANDPFGGAYAFSIIGFSGAAAGGGNTENTRYDNSIKYSNKIGPIRVAGIYQAAGNTNINGNDSAFQGRIGLDYQDLTVDAAFARKRNSVAMSSDSAATLDANQLKATLSDNTAYALAATYNLKPVKLFGGYEHIAYKNPNATINQSFSNYGYYIPTANINNTAFPQTKNLHILWTGAKYAYNANLDFIAMYTQYIQANYSGITSNDECLAKGKATCGGYESFASIAADYKFNKRFDIYGGVAYTRIFSGMYENQSGGGFQHNNAISPTVGARFQF